MKFNSESGKEAGKISKRGSAIGVELRGSLYELVDKIINELNYESLNASQKIKLLDVALKYSLPRLSIEKSIEQIEEPRKFEITVIDDNGNSEIHSTLLDENFTLKKAFGVE
jgi:phage tail tape-measure protein